MVYEVSEYQTHHPAVVVFLCIVYAVLSLVAFAGNALVIWIVCEFLVEPEKKLCICTGLCEKVPAKFGEESSVKADGLCIGCLSQWAEVGRENSNMPEFFCMTLYMFTRRHLKRT